MCGASHILPSLLLTCALCVCMCVWWQRLAEEPGGSPEVLQAELEELVSAMKRRGEQLHLLKRSYAVRLATQA